MASLMRTPGRVWLFTFCTHMRRIAEMTGFGFMSRRRECSVSDAASERWVRRKAFRQSVIYS